MKNYKGNKGLSQFFSSFFKWVNQSERITRPFRFCLNKDTEIPHNYRLISKIFRLRKTPNYRCYFHCCIARTSGIRQAYCLSLKSSELFSDKIIVLLRGIFLRNKKFYIKICGRKFNVICDTSSQKVLCHSRYKIRNLWKRIWNQTIQFREDTKIVEADELGVLK